MGGVGLSRWLDFYGRFLRKFSKIFVINLVAFLMIFLGQKFFGGSGEQIKNPTNPTQRLSYPKKIKIPKFYPKNLKIHIFCIKKINFFLKKCAIFPIYPKILPNFLIFSCLYLFFPNSSCLIIIFFYFAAVSQTLVNSFIHFIIYVGLILLLSCVDGYG